MNEKTYGVMLKAEMIRAYIKGQKSQTRRLNGLDEINQNPNQWESMVPQKEGHVSFRHKTTDDIRNIRLPYGGRDCTIYFKETYRMWERDEDGKDFILFRADNAKVDPVWWSREDWDLIHHGWFEKWQSAMFMPKRFARFHDLRILNFRVERLQDITESDAQAEGVEQSCGLLKGDYPNYKRSYHLLWDAINSKRFPWSHNPWLFVYEFEKVAQ